MAGAAGGFGSGFSGSLLNGGSIGDAFKAGVIGGAIGAASGALTAGIGAEFGAVGSDLGNELGRALAHGAVGGGISELAGGEFRHGFFAGFAGSVGGSLAPKIPGVPGYSVKTVSAVAKRTIVAATVGGTASALGGGKFANGAATAAFQHLLNAEARHSSTKKSSLLFEKGKKYLVVYDSEELGRGDPNDTRVTDRKESHEKATRFSVDLIDVRSEYTIPKDQKYDMIVFTQHGDYSQSGVENTALADTFIGLAPGREKGVMG